MAIKPMISAMPKGQGGAVYKGPQYGTGHQPKQGAKPTPPKYPKITPSKHVNTIPGAGGIGEAGAQRNAKNVAVAAAKSHAQSVVNPSSSSGSGSTASTAYDPLALMTPAQMRQQAQSTISAAYKSSFGDLNSQQSQLKALNAKRATDQKIFDAWAGTQLAAITTAGTAADAQYSQAMSQANASLAAAAPSSAAMVADADARQGNVSNNANSGSIGAGGLVDQAVGRDNALVDIGNVAGDAHAAVSGTMLHLGEDNAVANIADNVETQQATLDQNLTSIAAQRASLRQAKTGDIAKEIARLQGVNQTNATTQENYALAQQTLAGTNAKNAADAQNTHDQIVASAGEAAAKLKAYYAGLNGENYRARLAQTGEHDRAVIEAAVQERGQNLTNMLGNKNFQLNEKKLGVVQAANIWRQEHPNAGKTAPHAGNPGGSPQTANEQQGDYDTVNTIAEQLNNIYPNFSTGKASHGADTKVYQALANGGSLQVPTPDPNNPGHQLVDSKGVKQWTTVNFANYPPALINAAFDISKFRQGKFPNGLPAPIIAKLRQRGDRNVTQHLQTQ